jgi:hypothetical protein
MSLRFAEFPLKTPELEWLGFAPALTWTGMNAGSAGEPQH